MTLLQRLKALFGLDSSREQTRDQDIDVTVEPPRTSEPNADEDTATDDEAESETQPTDTEPDAGGDPVDVIDGIGPAYSDRLHSVGIETVADLAAADPQAIAAETDLSPARVERWIDRASQRL